MWIRDIYKELHVAERRHERLKRIGKKTKPPQPVNTGLSVWDRLSTLNTINAAKRARAFTTMTRWWRGLPRFRQRQKR